MGHDKVVQGGTEEENIIHYYRKQNGQEGRPSVGWPCG